MALAVALVGLIGALPEGLKQPLLIAGYALGALGAVALAATHRAIVNSLRSRPTFRPSPGFDRIVVIAMWVGLAGGLLDAFLLATELAK